MRKGLKSSNCLNTICIISDMLIACEQYATCTIQYANNAFKYMQYANDVWIYALCKSMWRKLKEVLMRVYQNALQFWAGYYTWYSYHNMTMGEWAFEYYIGVLGLIRSVLHSDSIFVVMVMVRITWRSSHVIQTKNKVAIVFIR